MKNELFDKRFIEFPLVCLFLCSGDKEKLNDLIILSLVDKALRLEIDEDIANNRMKELSICDDFDSENLIHSKILLTAKEMGIAISSIEKTTDKWIELKTFIVDYEKHYNKDAYCRMGKQLTTDVIEGKFPYREFAVLASIQSVIGKQKCYQRITYDQIAYRMKGFKTRKVAIELGKNESYLSSRQIKNSVLKLMEKKLLTSVTYMFREKYYSTRIKNTARLREIIAKKKLKNAELKYGIEDYKWSLNTKREIQEVKRIQSSNPERYTAHQEAST
jgi:hypothetical protein